MFRKRKKIFNESPVAYRYGPVFEEVYQETKRFGSKEIIKEEPAIEERILVAKTLNDDEILSIIEGVLNAVRNKTGSNLIEITHVEGGPWEKVYAEGENIVIDDETILKYNYKVQKQLELIS